MSKKCDSLCPPSEAESFNLFTIDNVCSLQSTGSQGDPSESQIVSNSSLGTFTKVLTV